MFKRILVLVDEQPVSVQAIRQGIEVARVNAGEILFFHLLRDFDSMSVGLQAALVPPSKESAQAIRSEASSLLRKASALADAANVLNSRAMGSGGAKSPAQCITDVAKQRRCDLIVVGTDSRNAVIRLIDGSIIPGLISCATVPVLVCRSSESTGKPARRLRAKPISGFKIEVPRSEERQVDAINS